MASSNIMLVFDCLKRDRKYPSTRNVQLEQQEEKNFMHGLFLRIVALEQLAEQNS